jgi:hypothetical protein
MNNRSNVSWPKIFAAQQAQAMQNTVVATSDTNATQMKEHLQFSEIIWQGFC